ncbi:hypothetical protein GCM10010466_61090 [Planomonospora alba]|uniref:Uncharacterized protein n=1 Tax=Planomonospora alba TaxID=161354 RepID=A0ABP6P0M3_9ACTN
MTFTARLARRPLNAVLGLSLAAGTASAVAGPASAEARQAQVMLKGSTTASYYWDDASGRNGDTGLPASGKPMQKGLAASPSWPLMTEGYVLYKGRKAPFFVGDRGPGIPSDRGVMLDLDAKTFAELTGGQFNAETLGVDGNGGLGHIEVDYVVTKWGKGVGRKDHPVPFATGAWAVQDDDPAAPVTEPAAKPAAESPTAAKKSGSVKPTRKPSAGSTAKAASETPVKAPVKAPAKTSAKTSVGSTAETAARSTEADAPAPERTAAAPAARSGAAPAATGTSTPATSAAPAREQAPAPTATPTTPATPAPGASAPAPLVADHVLAADGAEGPFVPAGFVFALLLLGATGCYAGVRLLAARLVRARR